MKNCYLTLLFCLMAFGLGAQLKLDPAGMELLDQYRIMKRGGEVVNPDLRLIGSPSLDAKGVRTMSAGATSVDLDMRPIGAIVSLAPGYTIESLDLAGVEIKNQISDNLYTVSVPIGRLEEFSNQEALKYVSVGHEKKLMMVNARPASFVSDVQSGTGLDHSYNGKGVVVGMFDTGIDPNHVNFKEMGNTDVSRVKRVWAYVNSTSPTQICTTPEQIASFTTDTRSESHGTHVMGIAAGAYNGRGSWNDAGTMKENVANLPLYGVATGADIVMAGASQLYDNAITDGVLRQIEYAEQEGKPVVINLSLGNILGPHDGTEGMSETLATLGERGIICVAAGNDGDAKLAFVMQGRGMQASALLNTVGLSNYTSGSRIPIQVWSDSADPFEKFEFIIFDVSKKQAVYSYEIPNTNGRTVGLGGSSASSSYTKPGQTFDDAFTANGYITFRTFTNAGNNKYVAEIYHQLYAGTNPSYKPCLRITRKNGQYVYGVSDAPFSNFSITSTYKENGVTYARLTDGTANGTISAMATGDNIICVGAYTSAINFGRLGQNGSYLYPDHSEINEVAPFSSYGINVDTKAVLPDISAPGTVILSSYNSYWDVSGGLYANSSGEATLGTKTYYWGQMQGTSMACPYVTGTVALMLEADPNLKVADVKDILKTTAVKTAQYNSGGSEIKAQWGGGKLQALEALKETLARKAAIGGVFADPEKRYMVEQSEGMLRVSAPGETSLEVTLYSTSGMLVARGAAQGESLELSTASLSAGIYIVNVQGNTGRYSTKLIVR